ncbi:50S ribosomal subunit protein L15 [Candidatus Zixiibacteriota bacterium]|nr:50S ribosomal subunit protein L15 [candidate division Zixibacteria bacterium]
MAPIKLSELRPPAGATHYRKRLGRGPGSGMGKTSGRGHKGQKARSGGKANVKNWSEGGQMPLQRRAPKRGFKNIFREEYQVVNLSVLGKCPAGEITSETLKELGIIKSTRLPVKILGSGKVEAAWHVKAAAFSKSAAEKIQAAGGKAEVV